MTKKHFYPIAKILATSKNLAEVEFKLSNYFKEINTKFDPLRFKDEIQKQREIFNNQN